MFIKCVYVKGIEVVQNLVILQGFEYQPFWALLLPTPLIANLTL
jgi:hypothetical protein